MEPRVKNALALVGLLTVSLAGATQTVAQADAQPNILLILTDDQRADTAHAPWMPNLQAMTDQGIDFSQAFANTSLCCPARATIFTGLFTHNHQILGNSGYVDPDFDHADPRMLPQKLQEAGYRTAMLGKYMLNTRMNMPPGWDEWHVFSENGNDGTGRLYYNYTLNENGTAVAYGDTPGDYSTDVLRDKTLALIERWNDDGPWFVEVGFYAPHRATIPAPRHEGSWAGLTSHRPPNYQEADISDKPGWLRTWKAFNGDDRARVGQLETLLAVDEAVQAFLDKLAETGQLNNTLVIFTSDGGMHWGEHWHGNKASPYEESLRLPLAMYWPNGIRKPRVEAQGQVSDVDLYATILDVAGAAPAPNNGTSLVPMFNRKARCPLTNRALLFEHFGTGFADPHHGVRTERWKYIETRKQVDPDDPPTFFELYDLATDPYELENILLVDPTWSNRPENARTLDDLQTTLYTMLSTDLTPMLPECRAVRPRSDGRRIGVRSVGSRR